VSVRAYPALRTVLGALLAILFAFAPLICVRYCTLRHASTHALQLSAHAGHAHAAQSPSAPTDAPTPPLAELQRMLLSIVEFVGAALMLMSLLRISAFALLPHPRLAVRALDILRRPPRFALC
jgi:hypothetical protein